MKKDKLKYYLFFLAIVTIGTRLSAQQVPQYAQYFINPFVYNPALSGYNDKTNAYFIRNQKYLGFDGGNVSNILTVDGSIIDKKSGAGISLFNDQLGPLTNQGANLSFSYTVKISEESRLGFGLSGGISDRRYDLGNVVVQDPNDPMLQMNYPARKTFVDGSAGIYFDYKEFQFGLAVPQLLGNSLKYDLSTTNIDRHYIFHARYKFNLNEPKGISLIPFAKMMFVPGAPLQYDVNLTVDVMNTGWLNVAWKSNYAVSANIGIRIKKILSIGYAYNFVMNSTKSYGPVNQEILAGFTFGRKAGEKEKRELEEAKKEIERLEAENLRLQNEKDSLNRLKYNAEEELRKEKEKNERINDSIQKLNEQLKKAEEDKRRLESEKAELEKNKNVSLYTDKKTEIDTNIITKTKENINTDAKNPDIIKWLDNHFLELDKITEAPKGYYVVAGVFGNFTYAEAFFNKVKAGFPEAKIIYNERNKLNYITLGYSKEIKVVYEIFKSGYREGLGELWILEN